MFGLSSSRSPRRRAASRSGSHGDDDGFRLRDIAFAAYAPTVLFGIAEGVILPVITISAIEKGASVALAAFIAAIMGLASIVTNIPAGALTTWVGERLAMVAAAAVAAVGVVVCMLPLDVWTYAVGVFLVGGASAVFTLARQSYLAEQVPMRVRARALSTLGGATRIGVFFGPFLGAAAMHFIGLTGAYVVSLVTVVACGVIAFGVPDLETRDANRAKAKTTGTVKMFRAYMRTYLTLGTAILLLSAVRHSRQIIIPLWAHDIGLSASAASIVFGIAGALDAATFYPAGKVMDRFGRRAVAVPSMVFMGLSFILMPFSHGFVALALTSALLGFANGIGSGIITTIGADVSPSIGRPTFLGLWREFADVGAGLGPVALSAITGIATLTLGTVALGAVGFVAAAALWWWVPSHADLTSGKVGDGLPRADKPPGPS